MARSSSPATPDDAALASAAGSEKRSMGLVTNF
jgi:hypothetical protein